MPEHADLVGTTDSLEAVGVFKFWKNVFFVLAIICLVLLQVGFWVIDSNKVVDPNSVPGKEKAQAISAACGTGILPVNNIHGQDGHATSTGGIIVLAAPVLVPAEANAAKSVPDGPNSPAKKAAVQKNDNNPVIHIRFEYVAQAIQILNAFLIFSMLMYTATILFSLKVSLVGRLGGINHITRAFFLALIALVLMLPWWQKMFNDYFWGLLYSPSELVLDHERIERPGAPVFQIGVYYFRYCGLWVIVLVLIIMAQLRTNRWAKATMRRLGVL
jgi:hypothetical protein